MHIKQRVSQLCNNGEAHLAAAVINVILMLFFKAFGITSPLQLLMKCFSIPRLATCYFPGFSAAVRIKFCQKYSQITYFLNSFIYGNTLNLTQKHQDQRIVFKKRRKKKKREAQSSLTRVTAHTLLRSRCKSPSLPQHSLIMTPSL